MQLNTARHLLVLYIIIVLNDLTRVHVCTSRPNPPNPVLIRHFAVVHYVIETIGCVPKITKMVSLYSQYRQTHTHGTSACTL